MIWYLWIIISLLMGSSTILWGANCDFEFDYNWQWAIFDIGIFLSIGGFWHGTFKLLGW